MTTQGLLIDSGAPIAAIPTSPRVDALVQRPQCHQIELGIFTLDDRVPRDQSVREIEAHRYPFRQPRSPDADGAWIRAGARQTPSASWFAAPIASGHGSFGIGSAVARRHGARANPRTLTWWKWRLGSDSDGVGPPAGPRRLVPIDVVDEGVERARVTVDDGDRELTTASGERLAAIVREQFGDEPRGDALFIFHNRQRTHVKILARDASGLWIHYKRLSRGTFRVPLAEVPDGSDETFMLTL